LAGQLTRRLGQAVNHGGKSLRAGRQASLANSSTLPCQAMKDKKIQACDTSCPRTPVPVLPAGYKQSGFPLSWE